MRSLNRREALMLAGGAVALALTPSPSFAQAPASAAAAEAIKKFTGGAEPTAGKITLDLPEIAENGNTVPLGVLVDSPMTAQSHVSEIVVLAEGNPNSAVVRFGLTPASGKAEISVRIRLAATQNVVVLARTSDGAVYMEKKSVKVTVAGCGG
jgi:sulfur-oxidizing protein SoxY